MKNVPIKLKLYLIMVPLFVLLTLSMLIMSTKIESVFKQSEELFYDKLYKVNAGLLNADRDFYQAFQASTKLYNAYSQDKLKDDAAAQYIADFEENSQQVIDNVTEASAIAKDNPELWTSLTSESGKNFETLSDEFTKAFTRWREAYNAADYKKLQGPDYMTSANLFAGTRSYLNEMQEITEAWAQADKEKMDKNIGKSITSLALPLTLISVAILIFAVIQIRMIAAGIVDVTAGIAVLATNDLSQNVQEADGEDEINRMRRAFAQMQGNLRSIIGTLRGASDELSTACDVMNDNTKSAGHSMEDIQTASGELANTATNQAQNVEDISKNMGDLSFVMERSAQTAENLGEASRQIGEVTADGNRIVEELTNINRQAQEVFNGIFEAIDNIQASTEKIGDASNLISGIANQTNLLSLNASIEAARAGEAGRGFAVVAEEIRTLSDESTKNVNTINAILAELQQNTNGAIAKSQTVKEFVSRQNESVEKTKGSFENIVSSVGTVEQVISDINAINRELSEKVEVMSDRVTNLSAISEENAATAQELSATSDVVVGNVGDLQDTQGMVNSSVESLVEIVNRFKL